jgi:fibronectin type 3 domain-containing protein
VRLTWRKPQGDVAGYDVHRAEDGSQSVIVEAVKSAKFADRLVLGGLRYTYHVRAFDKAGRHSPPSNSVTVDIPLPSLHAANGVSAHA